MATPIRIVILGSPASYQKATGTWHAKDGRSGTHAYDKKSYANWRSAARSQAADQFTQQCGNRAPIEDMVQVQIAVYRPIPAGISGKRRRLAEIGYLRPIVKPDLSNYLKAIEDACLTGIVIRDDRLIVRAVVDKFYSDKPRVEITVSEWMPTSEHMPSLFVPTEENKTKNF